MKAELENEQAKTTAPEQPMREDEIEVGSLKL
jgi:hypothetical protein